MTNPSRLATVLELRSAFDQAYAVLPPLFDSEHTESLLAIRLAGTPYAIRVNQITGLACDRKIAALPSPIAELLGMAGIRGGLVPVYSLATLLGHDRDTNHARWLALCGTEEPVGLAFSDFDGYLRIPSVQVYAAGQNHAIREHVRDAVRMADVVRAIVDIPAIVETIKRRCGEGRISKER